MDFFHQERYEMYSMSAATEIAHNVWLGPTPDPNIDGPAGSQPDRPEFDLLVSCIDGVDMPRGVHFKLAERQLDQKEATPDGAKDFVVDELEFPASGAILPPTWGNTDVSRLIDTCRFIYNQANRRSLKRRRDSKFSATRDRPFSSGGRSDVDDASMASSQDDISRDSQQRGRQILIHCYDGYTESSLLAIAYYMFAHGVRVHDAWLQLHLERGRNFFAYPSDVQLLRVVEHMILFASPACQTNNTDSPALSPCASPSVTDIAALSFTPDEAPSPIPEAVTLNERATRRLASVSEKLSLIPSYTSSPEPRWLDKMDGSLPSRIMPYMYLGNLAHANNPSLLRALGIGQVLSVGENLNWHRMIFSTDQDSTGDEESDKDDDEYEGWTCDQLRFVDGVQDNGVDPLMEELTKCLDFIENGRKQGIATLVHCRVGVSRSATICIAHVMAALDLSFPRAYCFVRARRLNVIIQPHLRFVYELLQWEEFLAKNRQRRQSQDKESENAGDVGIDADATASDEGTKTMPHPLRELEWASVAREIAAMNKPYSRQ
jgi:dual specificity MAP kinase phosphatase